MKITKKFEFIEKIKRKIDLNREVSPCLQCYLGVEQVFSSIIQKTLS